MPRRPGRTPAAPGRPQQGAVMVEFALGLVFILLIFVAYVQFADIFLATLRLTYAANAASRTHAVGGSASRAAGMIDKGYTLRVTGARTHQEVILRKELDLPMDLENFGQSSTRPFTIEHRVLTYGEPRLSGDNPRP